jgi:hypothetical protein
VLILRESVYDNMTRCEKEVAELLKEIGIKWFYESNIWDNNINNNIVYTI